MISPSREAGARRHRSERGAGLVELMIALLLGLMLLAGVFQVYLSTRQSYRLQDSLVRRQEALRYTTLALTRELRMTGYRGCLRDTGNVVNTLNNPGDHLYDFARHVQGFEATDAGWTPALHGSLLDVVPGTDVLSLRSIQEPGLYIQQSMPSTAAVVRIQPDLQPPPLAKGDIVLLTDCGGSAIFQVTQFVPASGTVVHNPGSGGGLPTPGNATANLGRRFAAGAELVRMTTTSYFIRRSDNGTGPALWRRVGSAAPQELVEGVENLQIEYGEDADGDLVPDEYRNAAAVANWRNVTAVRMALLAAALEPSLPEPDPRSFRLLDQEVGPFADRRLRRVVALTITLRNRVN